MSAHYDAIVIGGGPAGSTAAHLLAAAGWRVVVVEHSKFPRRKVCGEFISASTWPLLERLGVAEALLPMAGPPVTHVGVFARDRKLFAPLASRMPESVAGRAISRAHLDTLLLERAAAHGADIRQPWTLGGHQRDGDGDGSGYVCTIENRDTGVTEALRARIVIAAHGAWETVALPTTPPSREGASAGSDLLGFKAHFAGSALATGLMPLLAFPGGYGGMVHSGRDVVSLSCCIRRDALVACRKRWPGRAAGDAVLAHIAASCRGVADALRGASAVERWIAAGPLSTGIRNFGQDGVFAVGNAAAEAHPIIAEGISMAIQSSVLLAELLIAAAPAIGCTGAQDELRKKYARAWRSNFAIRLYAAAFFAHVFMRPLTTAIALRMLDAIPQLLTEGARWSGKASSLRLPRDFGIAHT